MRAYDVTTNTDIVIALPTLTVTVREGWFNPMAVLPPQPPASKSAQATATVYRGAECWTTGEPRAEGKRVMGTFEISESTVDEGQTVTFRPLKDFAGKQVATRRETRKSGAAYHDARYADGIHPSKNSIPKRVAEAKIPLVGLTPGRWVLRFIPNDKSEPQGPAGPDTQVPDQPKARRYSSLHVLLTLDDDLYLKEAVTCAFDEQGKLWTSDLDPFGHLRITHGYVTALRKDELALDLKPDVIAAKSSKEVDGEDDQDDDKKKKKKKKKRESAPPKARKYDISSVVVHSTSGSIISGVLNSGLRKHGYHYVVDRDGHVVKLVDEGYYAGHAGGGSTTFLRHNEHPKGFFHINDRSVGIENVHKTGTPYTHRQLEGLKRLLTRLREAYDVPRERVVGHSDVLLKHRGGRKEMSGNRIACPGRQMDWAYLERDEAGKEGHGWVLTRKELGPKDYSGFFSLGEEGVLAATGRDRALALRKGDRDRYKKWGGIQWKTGRTAAAITELGLDFDGVILELQRDLHTIGYWLNQDGHYGRQLERVVIHFIAHAFSTERRKIHPSGRGKLVNETLASYIKGTAEWVAGRS